MNTVTFTITIPTELNEWLKREAAKQDRSKNKLIGLLLKKIMKDEVTDEEWNQ